MKLDSTKYLGKPFIDGGRGPQGYDCWGLVLAVYRDIFGIDVPVDYDVSAHATMAVVRAMSKEMEVGNWQLVETPVAPCVVAMATNSNHPDLVNHCAIYLGDNKIMHALKATGVVIQSTEDMRIRGRIKGYFLWAGLSA